MKAAFSFLLLLSSTSIYSCELIKPVISLSGPMTMMLEELDLLEDKNLIGISSFHPVKKYNGKKFSGGIFLSKKVFKNHINTHVFFDRSREFLRLLKSSGHKKYEVIETRELTPFEVVADLALKIDRYTTKCEKKITEFEKKMENLESELKSQNFLNSIFFLGEIDKSLPELVIANDGFVSFFKETKKFKTYPTNLAYLPWSKKVLLKLKDYKLIGVSEAREFSLKKVDHNKYNIYFRGVLTPGIRQIYFIKKFQSLSFN